MYNTGLTSTDERLVKERETCRYYKGIIQKRLNATIIYLVLAPSLFKKEIQSTFISAKKET